MSRRARSLEDEAIERPRIGRPPLLTVEQVDEMALEIVDTEGFDALTLRYLGKRLGVSPMTIYTYAPNRAAICERVLERVLAMIIFPDSKVNLLEHLRKALISTRETMLAHPNVFRYLLQSITQQTPSSLSRVEHMIQIIEDAGVPQEAASEWVFLYNAFASGAIAQEINVFWAAQSFAEDPASRREYPRLSRSVKLASKMADEHYHRNIELLLDQLRPHLPESSRPRKSPNTKGAARRR